MATIPLVDAQAPAMVSMTAQYAVRLAPAPPNSRGMNIVAIPLSRSRSDTLMRVPLFTVDFGRQRSEVLGSSVAPRCHATWHRAAKDAAPRWRRTPRGRSTRRRIHSLHDSLHIPVADTNILGSMFLGAAYAAGPTSRSTTLRPRVYEEASMQPEGGSCHKGLLGPGLHQLSPHKGVLAQAGRAL